MTTETPAAKVTIGRVRRITGSLGLGYQVPSRPQVQLRQVGPAVEVRLFTGRDSDPETAALVEALTAAGYGLDATFVTERTATPYALLVVAGRPS